MGKYSLWLLNALIEQIKFDYVIPKYKTEVVFDTILSIFIEEIINGKYYGQNGESDKIKLIGKEFPIRIATINSNWENEEYDTSINPDYLLASNNTLYIVELKTSSNSYDEENQLANYIKVKSLIESQKSANFIVSDFIRIGKIGNSKEFGLLKRENKKYQLYYQTIKTLIEELNYLKNISRVKIVYIVPSALADKIAEQVEDVSILESLEGQFDNLVCTITLSELSNISLESYVNDEDIIKSWKAVGELFEYIDGLDEHLEG